MDLFCCMNVACRSILFPHTWVTQWLLITQASTPFTYSSTRRGRKCGASEWPAQKSILISSQPVTAVASSTAASAWGSTQSTHIQAHTCLRVLSSCCRFSQGSLVSSDLPLTWQYVDGLFRIAPSSRNYPCSGLTTNLKWNSYQNEYKKRKFYFVSFMQREKLQLAEMTASAMLEYTFFYINKFGFRLH